MTVNDLLKIDAHEVRRNPDLMSFYIETFRNIFGYLPNCAGCSFNTDWIKLNNKINSVGNENLLTLENNNIKYKNMNFRLNDPSHRILSYQKELNGVKVTIRRYSNELTEEFVNGFLTNGTDEEIEQRKKLFRELPVAEPEQEAVKDIEVKEPKIVKAKKEPVVKEKAIKEVKQRGRKPKEKAIEELPVAEPEQEAVKQEEIEPIEPTE